MRGAIDAGLEGIAAPAAQSARQSPIGAAAGERKAITGCGGDVIGHAGGKAVVARGKIGRADRTVAIGGIVTAERRAPGGPALVE